MSNQTPEEIRAEIERTRTRLGADVEAVAEKVNPESAVQRQKDKARYKFQDLREQVMGASESAHNVADDLRYEAADRATQAKYALNQAPDVAKAKTRGNPFAAGLIALGAGWLIGSMLPSTQREQQFTADAAQQIQPRVQQATQSLKSNAQDLAEGLKEPAQQAFESVKQTAQDAAQDVKARGQYEGENLKDSAAQSAQAVKNTATNN